MKKLIIIKVGTNSLINHQTKSLNDTTFASIGSQIITLAVDDTHILIVSSGAITAGAFHENIDRSQLTRAVEFQRYAARGWDLVVQKWKSVLGAERVSSTLLTKRELHTPSLREKFIDVARCCFEHGDVIVVNENDALSDDEIKFGDNDALAAELAVVMKQSNLFDEIKLVLLTNKDGLNKVANDDTTLIRQVKYTDQVFGFVDDTPDTHSRGGMQSKLMAAKRVTEHGVEMFIANGQKKNALTQTLAKNSGTVFLAK